MRRIAVLLFALLVSCSAATLDQSPTPIAWPEDSAAQQVALLNRVGWGASRASYQEISALGSSAWLERQLKPGKAELPPAAAESIASMEISKRPVADIAADVERERGEDRKVYREHLQRLAREAQSRMLQRAVYSPNQLEEQMTWFWTNHFSVFQRKGPLPALVADYEDRIRPLALGRFRDLLGATARHPAMLIYLDNARNHAGKVNENYARELMELHTLGVDAGYTQRDVQELARVLTGFSVDRDAGLAFRFRPARHDYGDKQLLGATIHGAGGAELDAALDLLARQPATARFVSRKLALFMVSDDPPPALLDRMAQAFLATDGDIGQVLRAMFQSPEFRASLGGKFKDPLHYAVSAARLVDNSQNLPAMVARLCEAPYARQTPDGYPLTRVDWASAGQLTARFEMARAVAYRAPGRLWSDAAGPLGDATRDALGKASTAPEWNLLLLSSPEFMQR